MSGVQTLIDICFVHFCLQYVKLRLRMRLPHIMKLIFIVRLLHIVRFPYIVRLLHIMRLPDIYAVVLYILTASLNLIEGTSSNETASQKEDIKRLFCTLKVRLSNISKAVTHSEAASHREEASCDTVFS